MRLVEGGQITDGLRLCQVESLFPEGSEIRVKLRSV